MAASFGKMPTTSVRRLISPFRRSSGFVECSFVRCCWGKLNIGGNVSARPRQFSAARFGTYWPELIGARPDATARASLYLGHSFLRKCCCDEAETTRRAAASGLARILRNWKWTRAPFAAWPSSLRRTAAFCDAFVGIGDHELDGTQAAPRELAQEPGPEGLGLRTGRYPCPAPPGDRRCDAHGDSHGNGDDPAKILRPCARTLHIVASIHRYGKSPLDTGVRGRLSPAHQSPRRSRLTWLLEIPPSCRAPMTRSSTERRRDGLNVGLLGSRR